MKTLLTILTVFFTVMFSSTSFAEWTKMGEGFGGSNKYVNFERVRKYGGYVYYWALTNYLKPSRGFWSVKTYYEVDCKLLRSRGLSDSYHKEPMGGGTGQFNNVPDNEWMYPAPNSIFEVMTKAVCSR